jgi:hypothetical protein
MKLASFLIVSANAARKDKKDANGERKGPVKLILIDIMNFY